MSAVRICLWPRAYSRAVETALDSCFDEGALSDDYTYVTKSNDANVIKVTRPTVERKVQPWKFVWTISNASVTVHHNKNGQNQVSGSFEVAVNLVRPPSSRGWIYSADVDLVDLLFPFTSHCQQSGDSKLSVSPPNAGPIPKRGRDTTPATYRGISQSIKSIDDDESICISGIKQSVNSSGRDAVIFSDGINNGVISSGDGASITCSGIRCSVNSTGSDAYIISSGIKATIHSSGSNASILSSGNVVITSSGPNAQITVSGMEAVIKSTGSNAQISVSGMGAGIKSSGSNATISSSGTSTRIESSGSNAAISSSGKNTRIQSSGSAINDELVQTLIRRLRSSIVESLNHRLPERSGVDHHQWTARNGYVQGSGDHPTLIHGQEPQDYGRMITLLVSTDDVVNAFRSVFHNMPSCNLTQADLIGQPSGHKSFNNVSGKPPCLSDFFPDFSTKYPDASVEVDLSGSQVPTAAFSDENLKVTFHGSAVLRSLLPGGSTVDCLTTEVTVEVNVLLELNPTQLKGTVSSIIPKSITAVKTTLGSVNREVLKDAFDHIATVFLSQKFNEICQRGIPLPNPLLSGFKEYENVVMSTTADGFLRMDADIKFRA